MRSLRLQQIVGQASRRIEAYPVALLAGGYPERSGNVRLAGADFASQQDILALSQIAALGQLQDERTVELGHEREVVLVEGLEGRELGRRDASPLRVGVALGEFLLQQEQQEALVRQTLLCRVLRQPWIAPQHRRQTQAAERMLQQQALGRRRRTGRARARRAHASISPCSSLSSRSKPCRSGTGIAMCGSPVHVATSPVGRSSSGEAVSRVLSGARAC